ncbi:lead, cadmium, zinc and mercury transporting ATPase [Psychrobacter sp. JCM 18901]|nr:lead, cadmium, zinc and mercury transporting ATPase [Psychrobacter sp. JCM 18901]
MIVSLILLGRYFEAKAKGRTSGAIQHLVGMQAKTARVQKDGKIIEIPVENVTAQMIVEIRPGERVPIDGEVVDGHSYIDESMITGEPVPVKKTSRRSSGRRYYQSKWHREYSSHGHW